MIKLEKFVTGKLFTNCYILGDTDTKEAFVFDAPAHGAEIYDFVTDKLGFKIKAVILTHGHFDHILGLDELVSLSGAPVFMHESEAELVNNKDFNLTSYFRADIPHININKKLKDGDILTLGENEIKVIHTPGHTVGGLCFLTGNILLSGDTLFENSVGKITHMTGDLELEIKSIKEKLMVLPDDILVYPGHGNMTTIGRERKENVFLR
ncbi:MAG: MBL fold metallo-hydrolase [Clostridia bacterium]|nr:MBL fold metallo-hydrolase [Clostridia bacterium]